MKERGYMCKIDLKDAYFFSISRQIMSSFSEVFMARESLSISVTVFWSCTSLSRRLNIRILIYLDDILLMFQLIERFLVAKDTQLSSSTFVICNKLKKVSHATGINNQIFRSCDKFDANDSFLTEEKVKRILQGCKIIFLMKEITVLQLKQSEDFI